jgi:predicted nucleotidyltransferase
MEAIRLEDVFGSRGRVAVLRVLAGVSVPLSIRQVAVQAGMSHSPTAEVLDSLVSLGLVATTEAGRSRVHWLERRSVVVRSLVLPALAAEADLVDAAIRELRTFVPDTVYSAVLFGSRARGDHVRGSDYDVIIVEPDEATRDQTLGLVNRSSTELRARLGASVSVLAYSIQEVRDLAERGDNFMDGVVRDGVLLAGVSPRAWGCQDEGTQD